MSASRISIMILAITAFGFGAWFGWYRTRADLLEPEIRGFAKLQAPRKTISMKTAASSSGKKLALDNSRKLLEHADIETVAAAIAKDDFSRARDSLIAMAKLDPLGALNAIKVLPRSAQEHAREIIFTEWLRQAPDEAWEYIVERDLNFVLNNEFAKAVAATGRFDLAARAVNRLPSAEERNIAIGFVFPSWAAADPQGFAEWAKEQSGDVRRMAMAQVAANNVLNGPVDLGWLSAQLGSGEVPKIGSGVPPNFAWQAFAEALVAQAGYARAKEVFIQIPPSLVTPATYGYLASTCPSNEALGWLDQIQDPAARTRSTVGAVILWTDRDPATAAQLSLTVGNPAVMANELIRILPTWAGRDPTGAQAFLQIHGQDLAPDLRITLCDLVSKSVPPKP